MFEFDRAIDFENPSVYCHIPGRSGSKSKLDRYYLAIRVSPNDLCYSRETRRGNQVEAEGKWYDFQAWIKILFPNFEFIDLINNLPKFLSKF